MTIPLSVVIPTYDTAAMTLRCCTAALRELPAGGEVIVVDDGSRDHTCELLAAEVPAVRVVRLETNGGFAVAANAGVRAARGAIVMLLNSDAIVTGGALTALLSAFTDERLGIAGAQLVNEDGTPQWSGGRTPTLPWLIGVVSGLGSLARFFRRRASGTQPRVVDWVSGAAMAFRAEVWKTAGPLSERYRFYCQDLEFCLRARAAGWNVRIVDAARVVHGHGKTIARDNALHYDPALLWPDLMTWGESFYGKRWAAMARPLLALIARIRAIGNRDIRTAAKRL